MPKWNFMVAMPTGHEFEVYHLTDNNWNACVFHSHPYFEFYILLHGSNQIMVEEQVYTDVQPYDLFIFPPGYMHQNIPIGTNEHYERAYFYMTESCLHAMSVPECNLAELVGLATERKRFHFRIGEAACKPLLEQIDTVIANQDLNQPADRLITRSRMAILVASLCKTVNGMTTDNAAATNSRSAKVMRYINRHVTEPISLDTLAEQFYISKYLLVI